MGNKNIEFSKLKKENITFSEALYKLLHFFEEKDVVNHKRKIGISKNTGTK